MKTYDLIERHIRNIDFNPKEMETTPFMYDIIKFIDENKSTKDDELIRKFIDKFGVHVELREHYALFKSVKTIKKWITFFGIVFIIEILAGILLASIYFAQH
ncbi:hypothetical protein [Bacteroides sp.]|uniref:hypothetical protein n=1 Tax=Bacteroides sp. TaxID=29523 RepID=UPI00262D8613|nr:hypothetical protein [Bacteroides sp.]MDD3040930.1 hypothetical protein [Bacteroides sp.]